jgi:NitT/TauT family transport system substrate-binding protein
MSKENREEASRISRRKFLYTAGAAVATAALVGTGVGCNSKKTDLVKLKSPLSTIGCTEPTALADRLGYYKEEGIEVEFTNVVSLVDSLLSSSVDFTAWGTPSFVVAVAKGLPVQWVAGLHQGGHAVITHKDSGINTFKDLLGKRIAVYPTGVGPADISFKLTLLDRGYDPNKDVTLVPVDPATIALSVRQRTVDAGCVCPHGPQMAIVQGWGKPVLADWEGTLFPGHGLQCGGLVFLEKFAKEKPEAAAGVKRAYLRAIDFINQKPQEAAKLMAEDMTHHGGAHQDMVPVMDLVLKHAKYTPMTDLKTLQAYADLMFKTGMVKTQLEMAKYIPQEYQG